MATKAHEKHVDVLKVALGQRLSMTKTVDKFFHNAEPQSFCEIVLLLLNLGLRSL